MDPIQDSMKSVTLPSEHHFGKIVSEIVQNFFLPSSICFSSFLIKYSFPFILSAEKFLFLGLLLPGFDPSLFSPFLRESWHNFQIGFQANRIRKTSVCHLGIVLYSVTNVCSKISANRSFGSHFLFACKISICLFSQNVVSLLAESSHCQLNLIQI